MGHWMDQILMFFAGLGYWGILLGLMVEVIPSELVLAYGGYMVSQHTITFWGAVLFGTLGATLQQIVLYAIGRFGGRPFLRRYGRYLLLKEHHIDVAEQWFKRYGMGMIFTARFIPVLRQAISIPGGMSRMSIWLFSLYTALASVIWSMLFVWIGRTLGGNWRNFHTMAGPYVKPLMAAAIALTVVYVAAKIIRSRQDAGRGRTAGKSGADYGLAGEKAVRHQLRFLGHEYRVLHRRKVSAGGATQEFDHLVVGPGGIFHIETKHWSGDIVFTPDGVRRPGHEGGASVLDPTAQLYRHEYIVKELLRRHKAEADVVGVLCFSHPGARISGKSPAFATVRADGLLHFIKTHKSRKPLTARDIGRIAEWLDQSSTGGR